jgi:hypothetical protein
MEASKQQCREEIFQILSLPDQIIAHIAYAVIAVEPDGRQGTLGALARSCKRFWEVLAPDEAITVAYVAETIRAAARPGSGDAPLPVGFYGQPSGGRRHTVESRWFEVGGAPGRAEARRALVLAALGPAAQRRVALAGSSEQLKDAAAAGHARLAQLLVDAAFDDNRIAGRGWAPDLYKVVLCAEFGSAALVEQAIAAFRQRFEAYVDAYCDYDGDLLPGNSRAGDVALTHAVLAALWRNRRAGVHGRAAEAMLAHGFLRRELFVDLEQHFADNAARLDAAKFLATLGGEDTWARITRGVLGAGWEPGACPLLADVRRRLLQSRGGVRQQEQEQEPLGSALWPRLLWGRIEDAWSWDDMRSALELLAAADVASLPATAFAWLAPTWPDTGYLCPPVVSIVRNTAAYDRLVDAVARLPEGHARRYLVRRIYNVWYLDARDVYWWSSRAWPPAQSVLDGYRSTLRLTGVGVMAGEDKQRPWPLLLLLWRVDPRGLVECALQKASRGESPAKLLASLDPATLQHAMLEDAGALVEALRPLISQADVRLTFAYKKMVLSSFARAPQLWPAVRRALHLDKRGARGEWQRLVEKVSFQGRDE